MRCTSGIDFAGKKQTRLHKSSGFSNIGNTKCFQLRKKRHYKGFVGNINKRRAEPARRGDCFLAVEQSLASLDIARRIAIGDFVAPLLSELDIARVAARLSRVDIAVDIARAVIGRARRVGTCSTDLHLCVYWRSKRGL